MALQICPKCNNTSFTWFVSEKSGLTSWSCFDCDYEAKETQNDTEVCENCEQKTKTKLKDKQAEYRWCPNCNTTTDL